MVDEEIVGLFLARREKAIDETQRKHGKYLTAVAYNNFRQLRGQPRKRKRYLSARLELDSAAYA